MDLWSSHPFLEILNKFLTQESCKSDKNHGFTSFWSSSLCESWNQRPRNGIFGKSPIGRRFCYFSIVSGRTKWDSNRYSRVFDNLTVKYMDALRKQIQSLADFVLNHCFWTYAMLRKFWEWSQDIIYFRSRIWFALISTRGMTLDKLLLPPSLSFWQYK